jgi:hypothetical protein
MSSAPLDRKAFLLALVEYAAESQTFNPHFHAKEMLERLGIDEGAFNILLHSLGPQYCYLVDIHNDDARYAINLAECLKLKDDFEHADIAASRHSQSIRLSVLTAILGAILGYALGRWIP